MQGKSVYRVEKKNFPKVQTHLKVFLRFASNQHSLINKNGPRKIASNLLLIKSILEIFTSKRLDLQKKK